MNMTPRTVVYGVLLLIAAMILVEVYWPYITRSEVPSETFRRLSDQEEHGREIYIANGCVYCHSQAIRNLDQPSGSAIGDLRIAKAGDYIAERPVLLGSERTGPDLSQEGGEHPDDWHAAHFANPRFPRPNSVMPAFGFLSRKETKALIRYVQSLGMQMGDARMQRQEYWKTKALEAFESGPDANVEWLHSHVPAGWRSIPNPYPTTPTGLVSGQKTYQEFCIGCHGPIGDGMGPAQPFLAPPPLNFTILKGRGISGGILYYQIMNGITGTAMPYFKRELESQKIWDVGDYVAVLFIGESDGDTDAEGIDAAWEPVNPGGREAPGSR